jgi:Uma2 family endonuclease
MPLAPDYFTADRVRALPDDGNRYELVYGELLVSPSPKMPHQRVVRRLLAALNDYCERHGVMEAFSSPADISWSDDTLVQPDVFVAPLLESGTNDWTKVRTLLLVAEVLSPSTAKHDRFQKRKLYQRQGVSVVWLVDLDRRVVEVWPPDALFPTVETERLTWQPSASAEPLVIELTTLFG